MQAALEEFVLWELMDTADMLGDAQHHLAKKESIALACFERKPVLVTHTLDPAGQRLALLQLGGDEEILGHRLRHVPAIIAMFDCLQSSPPPANVDASHQPLDLAAPVSGENSNSDLLRVKPGQQDLGSDGLHLARILDLTREIVLCKNIYVSYK